MKGVMRTWKIINKQRRGNQHEIQNKQKKNKKDKIKEK